MFKALRRIPAETRPGSIIMSYNVNLGIASGANSESVGVPSGSMASTSFENSAAMQGFCHRACISPPPAVRPNGVREQFAFFIMGQDARTWRFQQGVFRWSTATSLEDHSERVAAIETARIKKGGDKRIKRLAGALDWGARQHVCQLTNADPADAAPSFHQSVEQAGMAIRCE